MGGNNILNFSKNRYITLRVDTETPIQYEDLQNKKIHSNHYHMT